MLDECRGEGGKDFVCDRPMTSVIAARARNRPVLRDRWDWCRPALADYTQYKEDGSLTIACPSGKTEFFSLND